MMHEAADRLRSQVDSRPSRDQVWSRVETIKRQVRTGVVIAFVALFALVAQHVVGVTSTSSAPSPSVNSTQAPAPDNGFFGGDNGGGGQVGPSGNAPVLGSGGS